MADYPLSVIIVTFNSAQEIGRCLSSLYGDLGGHKAQVIVVDNASADGTAKLVAAGWPQVQLISQPENRGFASANNVGLDRADGDRVLLLNPDTIVQDRAIASMLAALDAHPRAGIVGPLLLNPDGSIQPSVRDWPSLLGDLIGMAELYRFRIVRRIFGRAMKSLGDSTCPTRVDWLSGACLCAKKAAIEAAGPMDEGFFMYSEEMEWQYRMALRGWEAWIEPAARVVHLGGASTNRVPGPRIVWQYRSIWRFYHLYRPRWQRLLLKVIIWMISWPKIVILASTSRGSARRRELLHAFWRVLWLG